MHIKVVTSDDRKEIIQVEDDASMEEVLALLNSRLWLCAESVSSLLQAIALCNSSGKWSSLQSTKDFGKQVSLRIDTRQWNAYPGGFRSIRMLSSRTPELVVCVQKLCTRVLAGETEFRAVDFVGPFERENAMTMLNHLRFSIKGDMLVLRKGNASVVVAEILRMWCSGTRILPFGYFTNGFSIAKPESDEITDDIKKPRGSGTVVKIATTDDRMETIHVEREVTLDEFIQRVNSKLLLCAPSREILLDNITVSRSGAFWRPLKDMDELTTGGLVRVDCRSWETYLPAYLSIRILKKCRSQVKDIVLEISKRILEGEEVTLLESEARQTFSRDNAMLLLNHLNFVLRNEQFEFKRTTSNVNVILLVHHWLSGNNLLPFGFTFEYSPSRVVTPPPFQPSTSFKLKPLPGRPGNTVPVVDNGGYRDMSQQFLVFLGVLGLVIALYFSTF